MFTVCVTIRPKLVSNKSADHVSGHSCLRSMTWLLKDASTARAKTITQLLIVQQMGPHVHNIRAIRLSQYQSMHVPIRTTKLEFLKPSRPSSAEGAAVQLQQMLHIHLHMHTAADANRLRRQLHKARTNSRFACGMHELPRTLKTQLTLRSTAKNVHG